MSRVSGARGRGKVVSATQNHLIGLEFEKNVPLFPFIAEIEFVFPSFLTEVHLAVEAAQILSLALLPYHNWGTALYGILRALHFSHIPLYDNNILGLGFAGTLAFACVVIVGCLFGIVVLISFVLRGGDDVIATLFGINSMRFVRLLLYSLSSWLLIPILENMLSVAYCKPPGSPRKELFWYPEIPCNTSIGAFSLAVSVVGISLTVTAALVMNSLVFDCNPMSRHFLSRAHALMDVPLIAYKLVSVALLHYFLSTNALVYHAVWMAISSLCLACAYIFIPPYFRKVTTQIRVTTLLLTSALAIFSACSHAPLVRKEFLSGSNADVAILFAVTPFLIYLFWNYCALARTSRIFVAQMELLHEGIVSQQTVHFPRNLPEEEQLFDANTELFTEMLEGATPDDEAGDEYHFTFPYVDYVTHEYDVELATRFLIYFRKFTQREPSKYRLAYAAAIFMKGAQKFRFSSQVRLSFANFLVHHAGKPRLALQQINACRSMDASIPERYQSYKMFSRLSTILHLGQSTRVEALTRAKRRHKEALHHTMEFWQLLLTAEDVDKNALSNSTRAILAGKEEVLRIYQSLLTKTPNNLDILACYTTFCETLLNDNEATQQCLQCLREGRDLKTQNTMRGAKVKGDSGTMTQIPLEFEQDEDSGGSGQTNHGRISWLLLFVSLAFVAFGAGFLAMYVTTQNELQRNVDSTIAAGKLRGLATQCAVASFELNQYALLDDTAGVNQSSRNLLSLQQDFLALHNQLTFGVSKPTTTNQVELSRNVAVTIGGAQFQVNPWTIGTVVSVALRDIANYPLNSSYLAWAGTALPTDVSAVLNQSTMLWDNAHTTNQEVLKIWTGVLLGTALVVLLIGSMIVYYNIHKVEGARADIFGLFTLIPHKVLRRLFRETRKRYNDLDVFFNLSTRKKLVKLIGADQNDQEKLKLNLDDKPAEESKSRSDSESRRSSISESAASEAQSDTQSATGRSRGMKRRGKKGAHGGNDDASSKKSGAGGASRSGEGHVGVDHASTPTAAGLFGTILVGAIALVVLIAYASTQPSVYQGVSAQQVRLLSAINNVNDAARESVESGRAFIFTGKQRYFERFVLAHSHTEWYAFDRELLHTELARPFFERAQKTKQLMEALLQRVEIAVRLSVASYPDGAQLQSAPFSSTFLSRLSWSQEESLLLTHVAPLWGEFTDVRTGLVNGSTSDLSASAAVQLSAARALVSSRTLYDLFNASSESLLSLVNGDKFDRIRDTTETRLFGLLLTAVIIAFLLLVPVAYFLAKRRESVSLQQPLTTLLLVTLCLSLAATLALTLAGLVYGATGKTASPFPGIVTQSVSTRNAWSNAINAELDYPRLFVASGNQLWNLKYRDVYFTDFSPQVVNPIGDLVRIGDQSLQLSLTGRTISLVRQMIAQVNLVKHLDGIAFVLTHLATYQSTPTNFLASNVVNSSYLSGISWNITAEPDYYVTYAKYFIADQGAFYSTRAADTVKTNEDMLALAVDTLYSHRADDAIAFIREAIKDTFGQVLRDALSSQYGVAAFVIRILTAAFSLAVVAFVSALMVSLMLFQHVSSSDNNKQKDFMSGASSAQQAGSAASSPDASLPFWGYAILAALVAAAGIVVAVEADREAPVSQRLNEASQRTWTTAKAYMVAQRMQSDPTYFVEGQEEAKLLYRTVLDDASSLYFRDNEYFSVGMDGTQDAISFDRSAWYSLVTFLGVSTAKQTSTTSTATTLIESNPYTCNTSKGVRYLTAVSRGVGLAFDGDLSALLQRLSYCSTADLSAIVTELGNLYQPLILGLTLSIDEYRSFESSKASMWGLVVVVIVGVAIGLAVLLHVFVLRRFVTYLDEEESSARLMLRIIPQETRESNKQIASYLESGRVKQNADDLNSAIASMSTLPVIAIDQKGTIMRFTQAAENVFQYTSSEVVGMNITCLMPEEIARNHDTFLANYRRTRVKHVIDSSRRVKGKKKNGDLVPLELKVLELKFGDESVYIGFARDISGELEMTVQDQLNKYVLDMSRDPIITIDGFGTVLNVNQAVTTVFGYAKEEMMRENIKMLMPSEIALNHDGYLARYRETGVKHVIDNTRQVQGQRKNGEIFQVSVTVREIRQHGEAPLYIGFAVDITEAHEAAMLNEVNDIISDLSPVPILAINDKGTFVKFSRAASLLFGYTKEELVGRNQNVQILVPPKYGDHNRFLKAYFTTGVAKVIGSTRNIIARKRDKSIFPAMLTVREIRKESMQPVFLGYLVDITQTLQLEEGGKLASEIMRFSMIPIITCTTQGIITTFNEAAEATFGYKSDEMIGQNVKVLAPPSVQAVHDSIIAAYNRSKEKNVVGLNRVVQAVRKNGEQFPVDLSLREVPESDSGEGCFFAYLRDVTSHRETLQQFMINDSMTQLSTIPIIAISIKGLIESFSPAAEECFGYSASEVIGENIKMLMPAEIAEKHDEYLRQYRKTGIKTIVDSTRVVPAKKRDGSIFQMEISVREIKKEGAQSSFVGYARDTSRDQYLEEQKELGATIRDLSTIPIILIDSVGTISYVNDAFCAEFQYTKKEALGKNVKTLMPMEIAVEHDEYLAKYVARGKNAAAASTIVNRIRRLTAVRKDGSRVEVETKVAEVRSERSNTLSFVGFVRNLGMQLQLEQANQTIDTITNLSLIPIIAIDHRGIVIKFSKAAEQSFLFSAAEVLGNNLKMLMPEEIAEKHDGYLRTYQKTHVKTVVNAVVRQEGRRKDGVRFPLELSVKEIVKQGQNSLFIGYARDASEDTELERAMQLSNLVTQLSPIPIVVINRVGIIQTFNLAASETFEFSPEEALGQNVTILMNDVDAQYHPKYLKTYAKTKIKSAIDSVKLRTARRKSGGTFGVEICVKEIIPSSGDERQICYLGFIRDLTAVQELKQAGLVNDTIASISAVPLIVITMAGIVSKFSNSAEQVFGFDAADVLNRNVKMLMPHSIAVQHDDYLLAYKKRARKDDTEETIERVVRGRRRTGEEFPAHLTIREVRKQGQDPMFVGYLQDMSGRFEVTRKKQITEASINLCSSPIISISPDGTVRSFNEAAEDCFGYTSGEVVGGNIKILMPRKTADAHDEYLATYLRTGVKRVVDRDREVTAKRKNGKRFPVVISVREVKEQNDHFFVGYVRDRSGIAALEQASLVNDCVISMSLVSIIGINPEGTITRFSPAAEQLFGYRTEEVVGANVSILMPEPHHSAHNSYLENYAKTRIKKVVGTTTKNLKAVRKDGSEFNCEISIEEIDIAGAERGYIGLVVDITERVKNQAEFAVALCSEEMSTRALIAIDDHGKVLRINHAASQLFNYDASEVLQKNVKMLMPPEIAEYHDRYLANYRETGIKHIIDSSRNVTGRSKNGRLFELEVHVKEVKLESGSLFLAYLDDVSTRKELSIAASLAETVMSLIPAPLVIINQRGIITHFNAASERTFEFSASQVVGKNVKILMPQEIAKRHDEFLAKYFQTGEKHIIDSVRAVEGETKTGQRISLRVSVREVKKQGNEVMFVGFLQPV